MLPYREPVHYAIAEVYNLHPEYAMELRIAIEAKASFKDNRFLGMRHEIPMTDYQWLNHVIVCKAHQSYARLNAMESSRQHVQAFNQSLYDILDDTQNIAVEIVAGRIEAIPVYMGGWIMTNDVLL